MTHSRNHDDNLTKQTETLRNRQKSLRYHFVIVAEGIQSQRVYRGERFKFIHSWGKDEGSPIFA